MHTAQTNAAVAQTLLGFAESLGLSRQEALRAAELRPEHLATPEAPIPFVAPVRIWKFMLSRRPGDPLGLMLAEKMRPGAFGLPGHLFRHSDSVEKVFERMKRYQGLIDSELDLRLVVEADKLRLEFHHHPEVVALAHPLEAMVGAGAHTLREWLDVETMVEVWFAHPALHDREVYATYLEAPVAFEQPANAVIIPAEILEQPIADADPSVAQFLERLADERLAEQSRSSLGAQVAAAIERRLDDPLLTQEDVATALGVSVRTMQRRLREEGLTYTQILDDLRCDVAKRLLSNGGLATFQVAERLGYAEAANFTRAFRRWTGVSPAEFRARG